MAKGRVGKKPVAKVVQKDTYEACTWFDKLPCFEPYNTAAGDRSTTDELMVCVVCQLRQLNRLLYQNGNGR